MRKPKAKPEASFVAGLTETVLTKMGANAEYFEEGLDAVRVSLEEQGIPWHGIRRVWKILRTYDRAGHLAENFAQDKENVRGEIENALKAEMFWQSYLALIGEREEESVSIDEIRTKLLEKMTVTEFKSVLQKEKALGHISLSRAAQTVTANFDLLAREAVGGIGLNIPYVMPMNDLGYPALSAREIFTREMSWGLLAGGMLTYFGRDSLTQDQTYVRVKERMIERLKQGVAAGDELRLAVAGAAYGMQGYDAAMAVADAMRETGIKVPVQLVITDAQYASIDYAKRGEFFENDFQWPLPRFEPFFTRDGENFQIASVRDFREKWGIRLAFEKFDVLNPQDVTHLLQYGHYDLIVATNIHYRPPERVVNDVKVPTVIFHSHLAELLGDRGMALLGHQDDRGSSGKALRVLADIHANYFKEILQRGLHIGQKDDIYLFLSGLAGHSLAQAKQALNDFLTGKFSYSSYSGFAEAAMLFTILTDQWNAAEKAEIFDLLLRWWKSQLDWKKEGRARIARAEAGDPGGLFEDWNSLTEQAQQPLKHFLDTHTALIKTRLALDEVPSAVSRSENRLLAETFVQVLASGEINSGKAKRAAAEAAQPGAIDAVLAQLERIYQDFSARLVRGETTVRLGGAPVAIQSVQALIQAFHQRLAEKSFAPGRHAVTYLMPKNDNEAEVLGRVLSQFSGSLGQVIFSKTAPDQRIPAKLQKILRDLGIMTSTTRGLQRAPEFASEQQVSGVAGSAAEVDALKPEERFVPVVSLDMEASDDPLMAELVLTLQTAAALLIASRVRQVGEIAAVRQEAVALLHEIFPEAVTEILQPHGTGFSISGAALRDFIAEWAATEEIHQAA